MRNIYKGIKFKETFCSKCFIEFLNKKPGETCGQAYFRDRTLNGQEDFSGPYDICGGEVKLKK